MHKLTTDVQGCIPTLIYRIHKSRISHQQPCHPHIAFNATVMQRCLPDGILGVDFRKFSQQYFHYCFVAHIDCTVERSFIEV